jgi:Fe-S-cluster containining protein
MVCDNCGICCQRGFYKTSEVVKGLIKYNSTNVIEYLKKKGINSSLEYGELYDILKIYEVKGIDSPKPCIFLNKEKKCEIHPSIIGENIRGKICTVPACNKKKI